jgi:hypothetical protein
VREESRVGVREAGRVESGDWNVRGVGARERERRGVSGERRVARGVWRDECGRTV